METFKIILPIEPLEERYSKDWLEWSIRDANEMFGEGNYTVVNPKFKETFKIEQGQFLDVYDTNIYKALQIAETLRLIKRNSHRKIKILVHDGWFPGIEAIAYARSALNLDIELIGIFHAGTWDRWDFTHQKGFQKWSLGFEKSLFKIFDTCIFATMFHVELAKKICEENFNYVLEKWPVLNPDPDYQKHDIVVFPHRLTEEKSPEFFDALRDRFQKEMPEVDVKWIKTKELNIDKKSYYELLKRSKVCFSSAMQETFGIAMVEAHNLGCYCVVPDRLSYPEVFPFMDRYKDFEGAYNLILKGLSVEQQKIFNYDNSTKQFLRYLL